MSKICNFKGTFTLQFSDSFFNYRKIWFHVNSANNCFIILYLFPTVLFWRQSKFFPSFFWNQHRLGFEKFLEVKLLDKSIVSKNGWERNKGKSTSQLNKNFITSQLNKNFIHKNKNSNLLNNEKKTHKPTERKIKLKWKKSASHGFLQHFLFPVFETLLCFLLCFINCEHAATIFFLSASLLLPVLFTSRCSPLLY